MRVVYQFGGFQSPLLKNGSATIQQGRAGWTMPVKFQLTCANGAPATYRIVVSLDDGTRHEIDFSLR